MIENPQDKNRISSTAESVFEFADSLGPREEVVEEIREIETWVTCRLDRTLYGLPVARVQEVQRVGGLTRVPHAPYPVRGVTNLRGHVLPVVDLRLRLGSEAIELTSRHRIVVLSLRGRLIGLLVDAVEQVLPIDRLKIEEPPEEVVTADSYYIAGVYQLPEDLLVLLDTDRVLDLRAESVDAGSVEAGSVEESVEAGTEATDEGESA